MLLKSEEKVISRRNAMDPGKFYLLFRWKYIKVIITIMSFLNNLIKTYLLKVHYGCENPYLPQKYKFWCDSVILKLETECLGQKNMLTLNTIFLKICQHQHFVNKNQDIYYRWAILIDNFRNGSVFYVLINYFDDVCKNFVNINKIKNFYAI